MSAVPLTDEPPSPSSIAMRPIGAPDDDGEHGNTVTVGRAPAVDATSTTTSGDHGGSVSTRRVVIGTVAGMVCLLAVAVSLLVFGRGGDDDPTTTVPPPDTQILQVKPPAPTGVTVTQGTDDRQVVVAWTAVGDGSQDMTYQVQPQTPGLEAVQTPSLSATFELPEQVTANPCFRVVAITTDGRISAQSDLACR